MKYIFLKPVSCVMDIAPLPGIPSLIGVLEERKIECEYINLEAIYTKNLNIDEFLQYSDSLNNFFKNIKKNDLPLSLKEKMLLRQPIYYKNHLWFQKNYQNFNTFRKLLKDAKFMSEYAYYYYYINLITVMKEKSVLFDFHLIYEESNRSINFENLFFLMESSLNYLKSFYKEQAEYILHKNPNIVGIQITQEEDLISALFLSYILKQKNKKIHINIGGNFFESGYRIIANVQDLFGVFFDSISIGDSTQTVIDIIKYLENEISIENVSNLLYLQNGELKYNKTEKLGNINDLPFQSFTGYKKEDYLLPEIILPVRISTTYSCYWGKCIYCTCSNNNEKYRIKSAENFVNEIEYLSKKYKTKYFAFWDNALHPKYLEKVADLLIKKKLNIKYNLYARLEKEFTFEVLKKMKKSGCIIIHWGLDSASQRICDYINKGTNVETAKLVLKASKKAGIYNFVYLILGFPTETIMEMTENLNFIKENHKNIDEIMAIKDLLFLDGSLLKEKQIYYKNLMNISDDYIKQKEHIIKAINKIMKTTTNMSLVWSWVFLYIAKYGKMRFKIMKSFVFYFFENKNIKKILNIFYKFLINNAKNKIKNN